MTDGSRQRVLVTVEAIGGRPPSLDEAARQLGVPPAAIDRDFGIVLIDPKAGKYSVQVDADQLPPGFERQVPHRGPFADPRIEPLGRVRAPGTDEVEDPGDDGEVDTGKQPGPRE